MTCSGCVASVGCVLRRVPGVISATVDLDASSAVVEGAAPAELLVEAVRAAGYGATIAAR